ncbi:MAG: MBL fold metallo-hydrolase [Spirochaetes bacterium]|nr:MBL fold metallo-hydrolase [Spirochaetota bacterium]
MDFKIVQPGLIEITKEEGVKDSRPSSSLIITNGCNILIDTEHPKEDGIAFEQAILRAGLLCDEIDYVIFTHLHPDHMGHKDKFNNATFIFQGSERLVSYFRNDKKLILNGSCLLSFAKDSDPAVQYTSGFPEMALLGDSLYIHLLPGHTAGSVAIFAFIDKKVHVFAGDIFLNKDYFDRMEPPGSSWDPSMLPEQQLFIKKNADIIIPGHGELINVI